MKYTAKHTKITTDIVPIQFGLVLNRRHTWHKKCANGNDPEKVSCAEDQTKEQQMRSGRAEN